MSLPGRRDKEPLKAPPRRTNLPGSAGGLAGVGSRAAAPAAYTINLKLNDFKGTFSFDDFFSNLVGDLLPPEDVPPDDTAGGGAAVASGTAPPPASMPPAGGQSGFPEAAALLPRFKEARKEIVDLSRMADERLVRLRKEVAAQDADHKETLSKLERGVEGLFDSFGRLDARISGVGHTAARIGDHLQSADSQRETATQTMELIKYLIDFNRSREDLLQFTPPAAVFSDDKRMGEAAILARKLLTVAEEEEDMGLQDIGGDSEARKGSSSGNGLSVAMQNLQEYCNDLENKLLDRFDVASQKRDLPTMAECAKILEQFQRGQRAMHRYVATREMFLDVKVMNSDVRIALGETGSSIANVSGPVNPSRGLTNLYKDITETMKAEAITVSAVFPAPKAVMALLTQRVMEQRVQNVLDYLLKMPSLENPPSLENGGLVAYLRTLAAAYEKTRDLAKQLREVGCGDLDVESLAESLFSGHKHVYHEVEKASLSQLFESKSAEISQAAAGPVSGPEAPPPPPGGAKAGARGGAAGAAAAASGVSVGLVVEFVRWNEEAVARCRLLTPEATVLVENVQMAFSVLVEQVSVYALMGVERAHKQLLEAAALRDKFSIGTSVSRRVAAAAAAAAEQAAVAGEQGIRTFMNAVKRANAAISTVHQYLTNTVVRILLMVDGAQGATIDDIGKKMAKAEEAVVKGLLLCLDTGIAEVERLLSVGQKPTDFKPTEDGSPPDHRPTPACIQVVAYLQRLVECAQSSLEGPNRAAFLAELGHRLHKSLLAHIQRFTFNPSGGLRLKRDISEYHELSHSFKSPAVNEHFENLISIVNLFIVAPGSLKTLVDSSGLTQKEAMQFIQLRDDYRSARISSIFGIDLLTNQLFNR